MEICHCGKPLHYTDPDNERMVTKFVQDLGRFIKVTVPGHGSWMVDRHYIALHGLSSAELPNLGFEKVEEKK